MDKSNVIKLQTAVGVVADGIMGPVSWAAVFKKLGANSNRATALASGASQYFATYGITDNALILAHFLAQAAHESGSFTYMEEIASGKAYEGRVDLGNTVPGYGVRYKGRGIFQLTGYANYVAYGKKLNLPLATNPTLAANPTTAILIACQFWKDKGLSAYALQDDIKTITKKINGGYNGLDDRIARLAVTKKMLGLT